MNWRRPAFWAVRVSPLKIYGYCVASHEHRLHVEINAWKNYVLYFYTQYVYRTRNLHSGELICVWFCSMMHSSSSELFDSK